MKSCAFGGFSAVDAGERLRAERTRLGFTQSDFADLGAVNRNTQGSYEKGDRNPDSAYLYGIAAAGADVLYVVTGIRVPESASLLSEDEVRLLNQLRSLADQDQSAVHRIVSAMTSVSPPS